MRAPGAQLLALTPLPPTGPRTGGSLSLPQPMRASVHSGTWTVRRGRDLGVQAPLPISKCWLLFKTQSHHEGQSKGQCTGSA